MTPARWVLHIDLDQFLAAVEVLRRPELAGRPAPPRRGGRHQRGPSGGQGGGEVRSAPFFTHTRSLTLPAPTSDPALLEDATLEVLERFEHDRPVRLLGVRAEFLG